MEKSFAITVSRSQRGVFGMQVRQDVIVPETNMNVNIEDRAL